MPKSLESDILLANCAWEAISLYNKNTEADLKYLEVSLRHCGEIGNAILKQGVLSLIWHNCLSKKVSALTNTIDKVFIEKKLNEPPPSNKLAWFPYFSVCSKGLQNTRPQRLDHFPQKWTPKLNEKSPKNS